MKKEPNFLSKIATAEFETGIGIRLNTMVEPGKSGPEIEFLVTPETAESFAQEILNAVDEWKSKYGPH